MAEAVAEAVAEDHGGRGGARGPRGPGRPQPGVLDADRGPSIMGLSGLMIATLMLGAWQAGWYGTPATPLLVWPFALTIFNFGG